MEFEQLITSVKENMNNLDKYEKYYFAVALQLFEKSSSELKEKYKSELINKINSMAQYYGQNVEEYNEQFNKIQEKYFIDFDKIKKLYDQLFLNCIKNFMNCFNEQKKCVEKILDNYSLYFENKNEDNYKMMHAYAQNKVNYSVILEECRTRVKSFISEFEKDIHEIYFDEENKIIDTNNENIFSSIIRTLLNKFYGKQKFKSYLDEYEKNFAIKLDDKSYKKSLQIISIIGEMNKKVANLKKQINAKFKEMTV